MKRTKHNPTIGMTPSEVKDYWIGEAKKKFGDKFDYSLIKNLTKKRDLCTIICPVHEEFTTTFERFMETVHGCTECAEISIRSKKRFSVEDYKKRFYEIHDPNNVKLLTRKFKGTQMKHEMVFVRDEFGICKMNAYALLSGNSHPNIKSAVFPDEYMKNKYQKVHKYNHLDFSKSVYTQAKQKTKVICRHHGEFEMVPNDLLSSKGCKKCYEERRGDTLKSSTSAFIKKAIARHGTSIDIYDKVKYVTAKTKVEIKCPTHGYFLITPNDHLTGYGCRKCADMLSARSKTEYQKICGNRKATLYLIQLKADKEKFYKVGITVYDVSKRFATKDSMPYDYTVISTIQAEAGKIWDLEKKILHECYLYQYTPAIKFHGYTECLTLDAPLGKYFPDFKPLKIS